MSRVIRLRTQSARSIQDRAQGGVHRLFGEIFRGVRPAVLRELRPKRLVRAKLHDSLGKIARGFGNERGFAGHEVRALGSFCIRDDGQAMGDGVEIFGFDAGAKTHGRDENTALRKFSGKIGTEPDADDIWIGAAPIFRQLRADNVQLHVRQFAAHEGRHFADVPLEAVERGRVIEVPKVGDAFALGETQRRRTWFNRHRKHFNRSVEGVPRNSFRI